MGKQPPMEALDTAANIPPTKAEIEEHCRSHCTNYADLYGACVKRVETLDQMDDKELKEKCEIYGIPTVDFQKKPVSRANLLKQSQPKANCEGQYFEYWHCIDHCTAPKLWSKLK